MKRSIIIEYNILTDEYGDVDERNMLVDEIISEKAWYNDDKTATDIEYTVVKCKPNGEATIKATFNYD